MDLRRTKSARVAIVTWAVAAGAAVSVPAMGAEPDTGGKPPSAVDALFEKYCASCHNTTDWAGGLALDALDWSHIGTEAESVEKIVAKLRAGVMPPHGKARPARAELLEVVRIIESQVDRAAAAKPHGIAPPGAHRLNRREYANAIRDLLALDIDPASMLPVDDSSYGFDNIAGTLGSSPALVGAYVSAASKISRLALGHETEPKLATYTAPPDYSQERHVEGLPFGTRGGLKVQHYFPADGEYVFNWTPIRTNAGGIFGNSRGEKLELTVDGRVVKVYDIDAEIERNSPKDDYPVRVPVQAGMRTVGLTFVSLSDAPRDDLNTHFERTTLTQNLDGFNFAPHVNSMTIAGPYGGKRPASTVSRDRILICKPAQASEEARCASRILADLAQRAFRRPVGDEDLKAILALYQSARDQGGDFEDGVRLGLQMILSDPHFIYRTEPAPQNVAAGQSWAISDIELASRLSFFLWSTIPDRELLAVARSGKLREPKVLERQVKRMLADPRSQELVRNFVGQWLQLRNLNASAPVADIFPDFDDNLRQDFRTEVEMLFASLVREDRSVKELLDARYTFLNERLARHYGIPNVYGSHFRRVELGPEFDMRRGLLGKGAILTVTSNADRTSTIRRGMWVDVNILGVRPPDPPPNTPGLAAEEENANPGKKRQTLRERMTEHARNPSCASCHQMMDPIGFAMESFDGIGRVRTSDGGQPLDLSGWLVDGTKFNGVSQLRDALMDYSPEFVKTMTIRLMTYALGRGVEYYDMPVVRGILKEANARNDRFSAIVLGIVQSEPFQKNQVVPAATTLATAQGAP